MEQFNIHIQDGSKKLSKFVVEENNAVVELYDWQREAIKFFFDNNNQAIYEVATGAGKTFCAIEILKEILKKEPKTQILIVVPKNVILEDTWFKELWENGFSIKDIGVYYGLAKEYGKITITNMQSLMNIEFELFDCIIFDEIHNYGTKRLLPIIKKKFKYKIGLSATLERMDNKHWKILKSFDYNIFKYSPKKALRDGILNPFDFINIGINIDDESREIYNKLTEQLNKIMQAGGGFSTIMRTGSGLKFKMLALMNERKNLVNNYYKKFDIVKEICKKHREDKMIIFNEYNKQTNKAYWNLIESGVRACVVHSDLNKEKRQQNMIDFRKDKYNVMLASKVLDEGYNLPKIDTAIIMAGNSTSRQTIQRMGRVLRRKDKPSTLYQIYCRDTIEEEYALQRAILFKDLCNNYNSFTYNGGAIEI